MSYSQIANSQDIDNLIRAEAMEPCWRCQGRGCKRVILEDSTCWEQCVVCEGTGELPAPQVIGVVVPHPDGEPHRILIEG